MPTMIAESVISCRRDQGIVEIYKCRGFKERASFRESSWMRSLGITCLSEEALEIKMKCRTEIPNKDQAEPIKGKLTIPDESRSLRSVASNELRILELVGKRCKEGRTSFRCL